MLSVADIGVNNVPAFLCKIWSLVDDPSTDELIAWDASGMSFHVFDQARFAKEILPLYFKHSNIASFIRQLNMYGFRKVVHLDSGAIKSEVDDLEFHHPYFMRGQEVLLENIKRKSNTNTGSIVGVKTEPGVKLKEEDVTRVLTDVKFMKGKQETLSVKMDKMKKENEALWREVASLRQKHLKQQQIVNKLIQFMVHLVGGNTGLSGTSITKRKIPLMINDSSQQMVAAKRPRYSKQLSIEELQQPQESQYLVSSPSGADLMSSAGPVIQEVIDTIPVQDITMAAHNYSKPAISPSTSGSMAQQGKSPVTRQNFSPSGIAMPSKSSLSSSDLHNMAMDKISPSKNDLMNASLDSTDLNNLLQVVDPSNIQPSEDSASSSQILDKYLKDNPVAGRSTLVPSSLKELTGQLDHMQDDLDGLKDMLSGNQYFDPSTLLSLFNGDTNFPVSIENLLGDLERDGVQTGLQVPPMDNNPNTIMGNELVQYHPSDNFLSNIADLSDIIDDNTSNDASVKTAPLIIPPLSEAPEEIDPMSFINTTPAPSHTNDGDDSLDTPLIVPQFQ